MSLRAIRYHDISVGHKVTGHESKCAHLHGHNYRIHFVCEAEELDKIGRVLDFEAIKNKLCQWLEDYWDHKFLIWENDPWMIDLCLIDKGGTLPVSFNPTAENMAKYLVNTVGPSQLRGSNIKLVKVIVEETQKCSASYEIPYTQRN